MSNNRLEALGGLHLLTDQQAVQAAPVPRDLVTSVALALQGGTNVVQLRQKDGTTGERIAVGQQLRPLTRRHGALLLVNDDVTAALQIDADGVHVGQDDMPAHEVRRLIGPYRVLGVSAYSVDAARKAEGDGADYVGVLVFDSCASKPNAGQAVGLEGIREISNAVRIPVIAIGGIHVDNTPDIINAGARGVAVIGAVLRTPDPKEAAQQLSTRVQARNRKRVTVNG